MGQQVRTISAASVVRRPSQLVKEVSRGAREGRYLAWRLFRRDLTSEFAGTGFGWLWNFADPLVLAGVFMVLRGGNVIGIEHIGMPFAVYVVFGLSLLQAFTEGLTQPLKVLGKSRQLLTQVQVPPEALLLATMLRLIFDSLCYVPVLLIMSVLMDAWSVAGFATFVLLLPCMSLLGMAISIPLIPLNAIYQDIGRFLGTLNRPLIFLCPTFYRPGQDAGIMATINDWNPIAILMNQLRSLAVNGHIPNLQFVGIVVAALLLVAVGVVFFRLSLPLLIDRV